MACISAALVLSGYVRGRASQPDRCRETAEVITNVDSRRTCDAGGRMTREILGTTQVLVICKCGADPDPGAR